MQQESQKFLLFFIMDISNRKAYFEYNIEQKFVAGLVLSGTEIKSLRSGKASFNDSYCYFHKGELFVKNLHISEYNYGTHFNHEPMQERKLLLHKKELRKLDNKIKEKGYTIVPLKIFFSQSGFAKIEIGLGKGKKIYDKRETMKARETDRDIKRKYGV
ncbi:MAG TPA: SsrA-binding protein SmpB [Hanamia sp.]|nr:SsrA-binding protein SmpB [Hanamia sp.]HZI69054.1 SsrA-binding protein SmpB [Hanamia sp.]